MVAARQRMLLRDLWHLRGQVIAAALVVMCGVASFVAMRCTYDSLRIAQSDYYRNYRFADVFTQLKRAPRSLLPQIGSLPGVAAAAGRVVMGVTLDVPGLGEPANGRLVSLPETAAPTLNDLYLELGRRPDPQRPSEIVASKAFARANGLAPGDTLGAVVNGRWRRLQIVGIGHSPEFLYEVGGGALLPDNRRFGVLWMGEKALASAFNLEGAFNDLAITLTADAVEADVIARLDALLGRYGGLGAYGRGEHVSHTFISDEIAQNRVSSVWIPGIFLAVAAFLLHIVLSRLVALQRTEIGLLKAFGYSNLTVGLHYLKLAAVTVTAGLLVGGLVGLWLGEGLTVLYQDYYRFPQLPLVVTPEVVVLGLAVSLGAAGLGAVSAVRQAVRLPPAVAMRAPAPASFHAGLIEHAGVLRLAPASLRMILRSLVRRRWKSLLSVVAVGCAAGILIIGGFFLDAMQVMIRVQFEDIQREDVLVLFNEPASAPARHEIRRLPGVLQAETFRSVPVRLRHEHREKRVELLGLPPSGELRRVLDAGQRPVALPDNGLLLTRRLGETLGVGAGDSLLVEVLEGARPSHRLPVAGLVDEMVGLGAYAEITLINRLMREGPSISGARLKVDPRESDRLNAALKALPAVAGTAFRDAMLKSFDEIMDRSLETSTLINIVFACIIAFGVIYNGARIALSERGTELASLRVLGFTRGEVTLFLLGEQAILTLAAIPAGFALGVGASALLSAALNTELYRVPLVFSPSTFGVALLTIVTAAIISGALVARRIKHFDLIAVLKTRE
ncbi:MAG TPA: FtsX-like permease family protein [Rhodocyclaceae bacterium]